MNKLFFFLTTFCFLVGKISAQVPPSATCTASLKLDGIDDYGSIPLPFFQNLYQRDFTIEFYLKPDAQQTQYPGVWGKTGYWNEIDVEFFKPGKLEFFYATSVGGQQYFYSDTVAWTANNWDHYAIVGDQANNVIRIYKNGILEGTTPHGTPYWGLPNNDSKIGAVFQGWVGPNIQYLKGRLDDFRVSDIPRYVGNFTPPQNILTDANTRVLYDFNSAVGGVVSDQSGNNNHLTLHNGASLDFTDIPYGSIGSTPIFSFNVDTLSACGSSLLLNATPNLGTYLWSNGDTTSSTTATTTGWYSLMVNNGTCSTTDSVFVSLVNAQIQQNDTTICSGASLTLSVAGTANIGQTPCSSSLLPANLQNGLVGYWPFCGNANDESGNGNNGILAGPTLNIDRFGLYNKAYNFDGNNDSIKLPLQQNNITSYSISAWFKTALGGPIVSGRGANGQIGLTLNLHNNATGGINTGKFIFVADGGAISIGKMTTNTYLDNQWHHVVGVYNGSIGSISANHFSIYVDNILVSQVNSNQGYATSPINNGTNMFIGSHLIWPNSVFNGVLDDISIWNRVLSSSEIQQLYTTSSNSALTYIWSTGDTTSTVNITPTQTTTYWVQVSNGINTCTDTIHITVNNFSNLIAQDTIGVCGNSVTINATPGLSSYSWIGGGNTASKTVSATGWYSLTASNGTCTATDSVFVSLVNAQIQQNDTTICGGTTIQLNVQSSTSDSIDLYNNFIFSAVDTISGKYRIWRKPSLNQPYQSLFNDNFHRLHVIMSSDMNEMIYVRYKRTVLNPPVLPMSTQTLDSAWVCRNNSFGTNEQVLFLVPNFNRDAIYSLDWSSDKTRILFTKSNDNYPNGSTRDGDVFEYNILNNTIINITNNWDVMDFRAKYINNSYDFIYTKFGAPWSGYTEYAYKYTRSTNTESIFIDGLGYSFDNTLVYLNTISNDGQKVYYRRRGTQYLYSKLLSGGNEQLVQAKKGLGTTDFNNYYFDVSINSNYIRVSSNSSQIDSFNVPQIVNFAQDYSYASFHDILYISDLKFLGKWSFVNGNVLWSTGDTTATINVNPTQSTNYWVQVSNGITTCTDTIHITVNNFTNLIAQDTISACGNSVTINATSGLTSYTWSGGGNTASKTITATGWYSLTASNGTCTVTDSVFVSLVNAQIQQNDTTICSGASLTLSVAGTANIGQTPCSSTLLPANLQNGLVSYWPFCGNANDASGNGNNGVVNGATLTTDRNGNPNSAYSFDGFNSIISVLGSSHPLGDFNITYSLWMYCINLNQDRSLLSIGNTNGLNNRSGIHKYQWGNLGYVVNGPDYTTSYIPTMNMWHHVVFTKNNLSISAYVDGVLYQQGNLSGPQNVTNSSINIGGNGNNLANAGEHFWGYLDDIAIWNRALNNAEINQLFNLQPFLSQTYFWSTGDTTVSINVNPTQSTTYWVQVSNGITTCTDTIHVTVNQPVLSINATPNDTLCTGQTLTLSGQGASTYSWSGGVNNGVGFVPASSVTYTVTGTDALGCSATKTIAIVVQPAPTVSANANPTSICLGNTSTLSATGGSSYTWQPGNLTGSPVVSPNTTTTYTVTAVNANGCSNTATRTVVVNPSPIVSATANPSTICVGASSVLSATGGTSYTWQPGGLTGSPNVSPTSTTTYTVTAVNANGCSNTATQIVVVNQLPIVSTSANPSSICIGASSVLSATGGISYTWQPGGLTVSPSVSPTTTTTYTVTAVNANGCSNTATQTIVVNPSPIISASANPSSICIGASSVLSATGGTSYTWQPGGLSGSPSVSPTNTTTYTVTAVNANGCSNTATQTIVVNPSPIISSSANPSSICIGASSVLSATGGTSYTWQPGGLTGSPSVSPTTTTTYTVTAVNANGCSNTATQTVVVNPLPMVSALANPSSICIGASSVLSAIGGTSYTWQPGGFTGSPSVSPTSTTTYTVTAVNANGCSNTATQTIIVNSLPTVTASANPSAICLGASSTLSATGGTSYIWQPGNLTGSPSVSPNTTTTYTVTASNANGCSNTGTVTIDVINGPSISVSASPASICIGGSTTLNALGGQNYIWQPGSLGGAPTVSPAATTTYTVTASNAQGCTNVGTLTVTVNSLPTVSAVANPNNVCAGSTSQLSASGGTTYQWQPGNLVGTPVVNPTVATTYTVVGTDNNGCSNSNTVSIQVNALPTVGATINPSVICAGGWATLQGTGATSYYWMPGNIFGAPTVFPNVTTTYTVTGTSANGCTATSSATLTVDPPPVITQNPTLQVSVNGGSAQFTVQCNNPNATYLWQRDNGFGFQSLSNGGQYSGVNTNTLTITNLTQANNGNLYRCQVSLPGCNVFSAQAILKVEFALGLEQHNTNTSIQIYPNPANTTLHIHTEPDAIGSQLLIRDLSGRVCYAQTLENENTTIPVGVWARGLYMLNVISNKGNWVYRVVLSD